MKNNLKKFGEALKAARDKTGITQVELAAELGCNHSFVTLMEKGKRAPGTEVALKIERSLKLPCTKETREFCFPVD